MNSINSMPLGPLVGAGLVCTSVLSHSAVLVDSIGGTNGTTDGALSAIGKAVAFTTGADAYQIDSAQVNLRRASGSTVEPVITAAIYSSTVTGNGSIRVGSTQIVTFSSPTVPADGTAALHTLNPLSVVTLAPNTTYFFVLFNTADSNTFWMYNSGLPGSPTGGGFSIPADINTATGGNQVGWYSEDWQSDSNPADWTGTSGVYNDVIINGTMVPEPSSVMLLSTLGVLGLVGRRR